MNHCAKPHGAGDQIFLDVEFPDTWGAVSEPTIPEPVVIQPVLARTVLKDHVAAKAPAEFILEVRQRFNPLRDLIAG